MRLRDLVSSTIGLCAAGGAFAQDTSVDLGTLILGARLFEEPAQNVPGSLTLRFPEDLPPRGETDLGDIAGNTPNITFQKTNADERLIIRGISAYPNALADPVGVIVNGVALPLGTIQAPTPIALDQAAVLVGPQGAHYGRNSEAGLISLEFAEPGAADVTRLRGTVANNNRFTGSLFFNRGLDKVGLVFALETDQTDGHISNSVTGDTRGGERDRITGYAGVSFETEAGTVIELSHVTETENGGKEQFRYSDGRFATPRFQSNYSDRSYEKRKIDVTSLRIKHAFGWGDFVSITGLTGFDRSFALDFDTSPFPLGVTRLDLDDRSISQEFRLSSPSGSAGPWKWSAGLSFYRQDTDVVFDLGAFSTTRRTRIEQEGAALFGFAEYAVSDRLRLGAGARVDHTSSKGVQTFAAPFGTRTYSADQSTTEFLPKFTAAYDLSDSSLLYGSLARGYLAGGYNYNFANSAANFTFKPEYTDTLELGYRFNSARTTLDVAAFYSNIKNKQIVEVVPGGAQRIDNAAAVKTYGIEAKLNHAINDAWSFDGSLGLLKAKATSFQTSVFGPRGPIPVDYSGNDLPFAPNATYSLGFKYDKGEWFGSVALNGSSSYYFDATNTLEQGAFATVDASVGWRRGNTKVTVWATNLFDKNYLSTALRTPRGTLVEDGSGRRIGMNISMEW